MSTPKRTACLNLVKHKIQQVNACGALLALVNYAFSLLTLFAPLNWISYKRHRPFKGMNFLRVNELTREQWRASSRSILNAVSDFCVLTQNTARACLRFYLLHFISMQRGDRSLLYLHDCYASTKALAAWSLRAWQFLVFLYFLECIQHWKRKPSSC